MSNALDVKAITRKFFAAYDAHDVDGMLALCADGALTGTPKAGDATLRFSAMSDVAAMVETMPLERAPEAYARMMSGEARLRMVLTMA